MHLSKLVGKLQTLDTPTMMRLKDYVQSPYFKVPKRAVTLFNYLYELHPRFTERKVNPESIGAIAENLNTLSKQNVAGSELLEAIYAFFAQESLQRNETELQRHTLSELKERHYFDEFDKLNEKALKELNENPEQDVNTFFKRHLLTELSLNGFDAKLKRTNRNDLTPVLKTLDEFYALKKLRYLCELLERQRILGTPQQQKADVFTLLHILKPYNNEQHPYVYLFAHVYLMLSADSYEESTGPYNVIKAYTEAHSEGVLSDSISESMGYCMNRCSKWFNRGYEQAADEYLWWIDLRMKKNLLLENGKILPVTFRNIISIAAISKNNPEWMERFIQRYEETLPPAHREANVAFGLGLFNYKRGKYKEAIRHLMVAQAGEEINFNCVIRRWQFMCLYQFDSQDTDTLTNHLLSFEKYLQRHTKHITSIKHVFDKFIHYGQILVQSSSGEVGETLLLTLQGEEHFPGKHWLLQQLGNKAPKARTKSLRA